MTEFSGMWTTSGTPSGDQQASYTQAQLSTAFRILSACGKFEGVGPTFLNELAPTDGGANTVNINTGGAMVDGKFYENDASLPVNVPSAVGGGNTRIDRIVLRANWAGFEVAITRIAGTDAATPSVPAVTQSSETTYDIKLCQVLVDTGGTVTVTDEREWAIPEIDESSLTHILGTLEVKDDGIDDTKAGNRVPQFYRRQGGSASDWSADGSTDYTPTAVRMQAGVWASYLHPGTSGSETVTITFPQAFSNIPIVVVGAKFISGTGVFLSGETAIATIEDLTASSMTLRLTINYPTFAEYWDVHWFAVGPE